MSEKIKELEELAKDRNEIKCSFTNGLAKFMKANNFSFTVSTHEMRHSSMITGVDKSGIPLSFALAMEITPVKDMMAEMYQETGSYENAIVKKAIQPAKSIIKDIMGEFDAKDIQSKRGDVSGMLNTSKIQKGEV